MGDEDKVAIEDEKIVIETMKVPLPQMQRYIVGPRKFLGKYPNLHTVK